MKGPKVVLIGAASAFFGRQTIWSMVNKPALKNGTLALVDTNTTKLKWMETIARKSIEATSVPLKLEVSTNRKDVLKKAETGHCIRVRRSLDINKAAQRLLLQNKVTRFLRGPGHIPEDTPVTQAETT